MCRTVNDYSSLDNSFVDLNFPRAYLFPRAISAWKKHLKINSSVGIIYERSFGSSVQSISSITKKKHLRYSRRVPIDAAIPDICETVESTRTCHVNPYTW
jgi:hypothetical protein